MPIRLRFALHGKRHNRIFHLVAINSRRARNDKPTELLGIYNPHQTRTFEWSVDRIRYWLAVGAQPSASVARLLEKGGILSLDSPY
ncbi:ribosomal protein S16, partial [Cylindrobasidium torrendii FP15055 ss-10]